MDLYRINLNLLVALDALLSEQNVTRAAKKLFITQAAMSNNLQQLRTLFKDELLIREKKQMLMTNNARLLQPKIHKILQELTCVINNGQYFNSQTSKRIFQIGMSDYFTLNVLPKVLTSLQKEAPNIKISVHPIHYINDAAPLENGECDLIIGRITNKNTKICHVPLFKDDLVCMMNPKHALANKDKITLDDYLNLKHITVSTNNIPSLVDDVLSAMNKSRDIQLILPYLVPILKIIEKSDTLTATIPRNLACLHYEHKRGLVMKNLPFKAPPVEYYIGWHEGANNDPGHQWLRNLIMKSFQSCVKQID